MSKKSLTDTPNSGNEINNAVEAEENNISLNIDENLQKLKGIFVDCFDLIIREFTTNGGKLRCFIAYFDGTIDKELLNNNVLKPLMTDSLNLYADEKTSLSTLINHLEESAVSIAQVNELSKMSEIVKNMLRGVCVLFVDANSTALTLGVTAIEARKVDKAENEPVVRGPGEGFVESLTVNISLIRKRIKTEQLKLEKLNLGRISNTDIVIAYIKGLAEDTLVEEIRQRLKRIDIDIILESGNLEQLIEDTPLSPFPQMEASERPDNCAMALADGRVAIIIDGTPYVILLPVVFSNFLTSTEDSYARTYFAPFIISFRYIAFLLSLLAPSLYIAITTFHQEMIPFQLLTTLAASRSSIPFSGFVEALLMESTFELLREASERLPRTLSQSLSIVGAIVVGQAAVQAGLVSPSMVVILSVTATSSFVNPKISMSRAIRVIRFPLMILAATLGIFGIVMGLLVILIHMASLRSFGVCYITPFAPISLKDYAYSIFKLPLRYSQTRPSFIQDNNPTRVSKTSMSKPPKNDS